VISLSVVAQPSTGAVNAGLRSEPLADVPVLSMCVVTECFSSGRLPPQLDAFTW